MTQIFGFSLSEGDEMQFVRMPSDVTNKTYERGARKLPQVVLHMSDADNGTLFVNSLCASSGALSEATAIMKKIGYRAGDEYRVVFPNGEQVMGAGEHQRNVWPVSLLSRVAFHQKREPRHEHRSKYRPLGQHQRQRLHPHAGCVSRPFGNARRGSRVTR